MTVGVKPLTKSCVASSKNGTWNYKGVVASDELLGRKESMHIGRLMTILSVKHWETSELRKLKARVVFRSDDVRDQDNNLAVLQEAKVNATGLAGINANLAYGCFPNHSTTQRDVVRAYNQSELNTRVPTWVELPAELVPDERKNVRRPCVRLYKSFYGHPEAGYHWDQRFKKTMEEMGATHCADAFQPTHFFKDAGLILTLYVDDMILSGPTVAHEPFWQHVRKFIEIEEPAPVNRVPGRNHKTVEDERGTRMLFDVSDFAKNACASYENLSGCTLKTSNAPFLPDGSLVTSDFEERGSMAADASKIIMKILWRARLSRPDLMKGISDLTRKITTWSKADDRKIEPQTMCLRVIYS